MAEQNADLLRRDVDGSSARIKNQPAAGGPRLSRNFKRFAAGALGLASVGILVGIFTAGNRRPTADDPNTAGAPNTMVGLTAPDLESMERTARERSQHGATGSAAGLATSGVSDAKPQGSQFGAVSNSALADHSLTSAAESAATARAKHQQWLDEEKYKILETQVLAAQSATLAKLSPEGAEHAGIAPASPTAAAPTMQDGALTQLLQTSQSLQTALAAQAAPTSATTLPSSLSSLAAGALGGLRGAGALPTTSDSQATNRAFLERQSDTSASGYLPAAVQPALSEYELFAGSVIPATLTTGIQSDLPGAIAAQVRQTVYDSRHPDVVLIPQGTRLIGLYTSQIAYGQRRVLVAWNRLIFPNGATIELGGMQGTDSVGQAGLADQVNNHYSRIFGSAVLMSVLGVGAQLSQPQNSSSFTSPSSSQQAASALANEINQVGTELLSKNLAIQPTLTIRPGDAFDVFVNRTMILPPYVDKP